jgi:hypothetical protein
MGEARPGAAGKPQDGGICWRSSRRACGDLRGVTALVPNPSPSNVLGFWLAPVSGIGDEQLEPLGVDVGVIGHGHRASFRLPLWRALHPPRAKATPLRWRSSPRW